MIAAVGLDAATIGIHCVNFRSAVDAEGVCRFKQDAPVTEYIRGHGVGRRVRQVEGFVAEYFLCLDDEPASNSSSVNDAIVGKIERPDTVISKRCNLMQLALCEV